MEKLWVIHDQPNIVYTNLESCKKTIRNDVDDVVEMLAESGSTSEVVIYEYLESAKNRLAFWDGTGLLVITTAWLPVPEDCISEIVASAVRVIRE